MVTPAPHSWLERSTRHIGGSQTVKNIGGSTSIAALFAIGGWLTDTVFKDADPKVKHLINAVFGIPLLTGIPGIHKEGLLTDDLLQIWKKDPNIPDFVMSALTTTIATLGVAKSDREMIQSAAMLAALFAMAGHLEEGVKKTSKHGISELEDSIPKEVIRLHEQNGQAFRHTVPLDEIKPGDRIVVTPNQYVPVDGKLVSAHFNGEQHPEGVFSLPHLQNNEGKFIRLKADAIQNHIPQGAIARETELILEATATAKESTTFMSIDKLREGMKAAKGSMKHSITHIVNNVYVPIMLAAVGAQFAYTFYQDHKKHDREQSEERMPASQENQSVNKNAEDKREQEEKEGHDHGATHKTSKAVRKATSLAIKMAPCAIMAATLVLPFVKNRLLSDFGILVSKDAALERARKTSVILSDIRGTLTTGKAKLTGLHLWQEGKLQPCEKTLEDKLLHILGKVESQSDHALATTLCREAEARGMPLGWRATDKAHSVPGMGLHGVLHDGLAQEADVLVGSRHLMAHKNQPLPDGLHTAATQLEDAAYFRIEHEGKTHWGCAAFTDELRPGVKETIEKLRKDGKKIVLVTGMEEDQAQHYMQKLNTPGLSENPIELRAGYAGTKNQNNLPLKAEVVDELKGKGVIAAFGDDHNDAEFFNRVHDNGGFTCAIRGGAGSTREVSSMVMNGIDQFPDFMKLSKQLDTALKLNVTAAGAWMTFLVGSHFFAPKTIDSPTKASIAHELPTFLLTLGSLLQSMHMLKGSPASAAVR